jgi:hypothetical protein
VNSVRIFLTHDMVEPDQFSKGIGFGVYAAITRFYMLASAPGIAENPETANS